MAEYPEKNRRGNISILISDRNEFISSNIFNLALFHLLPENQQNE